jgi:2-polyprenyl-6-methoxyphenol hydroxylase-like FAD-dependent oxidoreductase
MRTGNADVLVVGAGPVGLTIAAELARHGASCRIIDKLAAPLPYCRAIGVTPRTLEVWDDMGIARSMIDAGLWLRGNHSFLNGAPAQETIVDLSDLPYGHLGIPQPDTERLLTAHLARFGIAIEREVTLAAFSQDDDLVNVELVRPDQSTDKAAFQYIVGCDGAHSTVRRILEIPFEGDHFAIGFMLGDVVLDCGLPRGMMLRSITPRQGGAPDFLVAIPLPEKNRYRVSMLAPQRSSDAAAAEHGLQTQGVPPTLEELQVVADRLVPTKITISDLRWSSNFRIGMRLAARYRGGRGFLAGDAAHIHPPTGGQGMNTGIQDAYSLAWKMALVLNGKASPKLLDTYDAERRPVGADVVSRTRSASEQFGRHTPTQNERLVDTQVLVNYRDSELSCNEMDEPLDDLRVQAGDRAPDCFGLRRENIQAPFRLFDVLRGPEFVLLVYFGPASEQSAVDLLEGITQRLIATNHPSVRVAAIFAPHAKLPDIIGVATLVDSEGKFEEMYKPGIHTAYLIRPDGYIGYHGRPITEQGLAAYFARIGFAFYEPF